MIVDPFPCPRQCIEQSCVLQGLQLTARQHPLPDHFRVVVGAVELITRGHEATETGLAYAPVSQAHGHNPIV